VLPGAVVPGAVPSNGGSAPAGETLPSPKPDDKKPMGDASTRARLIVELPPDARLYIDDRAMKNTEPVRNFNTPDLEPGQLYYYELRAEVVRDGKPVTQTKRVIVRAGAVIRASFPELTAEDSVATVKK
jgi:uncharacterized protein (TIGR03000 family)